MDTKIWHCIGLMSGTSLDGIDVAYIKFKYTNKWEFQILHAHTYKYDKTWLNTLKKAFFKKRGTFVLLDKEYGEFLGHLINQFINSNNIINQVDFIASHGHTIHHQPEIGYTLQIGDGKSIANITKIKTIYDFRTQDVNLGGQGAPLVPIGDKLLFSEYEYCLNLGGFANISFTENNTRIAYDICAVNTVLNYFSNQIGLAYDNGGAIARKGKLHTDLFDKLNNLPFYKQDYPKSLGIEFVNDTVLPLMKNASIAIPDILNTYCQHIAFQIASNIKSKGVLFITGGGAFNSYLIECIKEYVSCEVKIPTNEIIDYKEALIFAFLGVLRLEDQINCISSVTGAIKDHCSGVIV